MVETTDIVDIVNEVRCGYALRRVWWKHKALELLLKRWGAAMPCGGYGGNKLLQIKLT